MVRFEGDKDFPQAPADLWTKLTDARFVASCIPDVESISVAEPDRAELVLRPGFSFVRGTLEVTLRVADATAPTSARYLVSGKGIGSSSEVEAAIEVTPREAGSHVHWTAEVKTLGGLLKMVPPGLVRGAAEKVVHDVWAAVEAKLANG